MDRQLATIQQIVEKKPIEGADLIEAVRVKGWWVVAKKDEFHVGDKCVYFEIDSVLPICPKYEFLRKSCYVKKDWLGEGFRLRTIRLRGQVSQGLVVPLSPLYANESIGTDITEELRVKKWDPPVPACIAGMCKGNFPSFIPKTDQERIQNVYDEYSIKYKDVEFEASVKLDGSSCTIYVKDGVVGVCSRNLELKMTDENSHNSMVKIANSIKDSLVELNRNIAIQGELIGPGIQKNPENLKEVDIYVFDIFDIDKQKYLLDEERKKITLELGLYHVPIRWFRKVFDKTLDEILLDSTKIKSLVSPMAEGVVYKSLSEPNISFKAINNEYLLKNKE